MKPIKIIVIVLITFGIIIGSLVGYRYYMLRQGDKLVREQKLEEAEEKYSSISKWPFSQSVKEKLESLKHYQNGIKAFNNKDCRSAQEEFKKVSHKESYYEDAQNKIKECESMLEEYVAIVNGTIITKEEFQKEMDAIMFYYKKIHNVDFSTNEGKEELKKLKSNILDLLIENEIIKQEAEKRLIKVTDQEIENEYQKIVESSGGEEKFRQTLKEYYNWTSEDFKPKIEFQLLEDKLEETILKDDEINKEARGKIDVILNDLKEGADFSELAKNFSEDGSAKNGGDLGFISRGSGLSSELENAAFALENGQISDAIKTKQGYNIIKLEEKKDEQVHIRLILIQSKDFYDWLDEIINQADIKKNLPGD